MEELWEQGARNLIDEWPDVYISAKKARGYVATLDLSRRYYDHAHTEFWGRNDAARLIGITERERRHAYRNMYLSLNAFQAGPDGVIRRKENHLAQIRNIGLDIDCYNVGLTAEEAAEKIRDMIVKSEIPNPNLLIWSGNGLQLIYSIEGGAAPTDGMKWLARYITTQLVGKTAKLGADYACGDLARVFRLPGTINEKPGKKKRRVGVEIWRRLEYTVSDLYAYCEPYKRQNGPGKVLHLPDIKAAGNSVKALNLARAEDLIRLIEIRGGAIENRNMMTYDYCVALALNDLSESQIVEAAQQLDARFDCPQKPQTVKRTARSAYKVAREYWKAYAENGYKKQGLEQSLVKPKQNRTIIDQQGIRSEEMAEMTTLIDQGEKYKRKVAKRRASGSVTMAEYNDSRATQKAEKIETLRVLKAENPTAKQSELAAILGVSLPTVKKYLKEL